MNSILPGVVLLITSNVFMTFAWCGYLKHKTNALWLTILAGWGLAFFEHVRFGQIASYLIYFLAGAVAFAL